MRNFAHCLGVVAFLLSAGPGLAANPPSAPGQSTQGLTPEQQALVAKFRDISATLNPRGGDIPLKDAQATLHLGQAYYFIGPEASRRVLVEAWGNPPSSADGVLGMIFPAGKTFADDTWAAVVTYEAEGYVPDDDARDTNYEEMITELKNAEPEVNAERKKGGYPEIHLVGWAQPPYYDQAHHTLVWARNIHFGTETDNTLNYDMRALGRRGVLSMSILSTMSKIGDVRAQSAKLQNIGTFDKGSRYQDYRDGDKTAEYGVAGLVAAGVGLAVAKKLGFLALVLLFAKKGLIFILAGAAGVWAWVRRFFGKKDEA